MTCDDEAQKVETQWEAVEEADLELSKARRKLENRLKDALAACGIGVVGGFAGGTVGLILGGGAVCIAALLRADDAAADYEFAVATSELAHQRHARAVYEELMCLAHCNPQD